MAGASASPETQVFLCSNRAPKPDASSANWADEWDAYKGNPVGDCPVAQACERSGSFATYEDIIQRCPEIMTSLHEQGAPREINCILALAQFCEATKD